MTILEKKKTEGAIAAVTFTDASTLAMDYQETTHNSMPKD